MLIISIYLFLLDSKATLFASGFLVGISIAIRPLGWAFIAAIILIHCYQFIKGKKLKLKIISVYTGTALFIVLFGSFTYSHFGNFEFTSTTGPVNLLLGANDDATGGFNATVHEKGKIGYLENPESMTYKQKGDFYFNQAAKWIKENPEKWITLIPMKIIHSFVWDDVSVTALFNVKNWSLLKSIKKIFIEKELSAILPNSNLGIILIYVFVQFVHHLFYFISLYMIILGIADYFKGKNRSRELNLILIFSLISMLFIVATVGTPRYKYHIMILLLPFAADYFERKLFRGRKEIAKS
jgi:hypothetical protein